jgi:hypothetical protein
VDTLIEHSKESDLKPDFLGEGSKIELYVFESIDKMKGFLREVGVADTFIDNFSRFKPAGQAMQTAATYALAASLIAKFVIIRKYTIAKDMGVKHGHTGKLTFSVDPGYLLVVAKNANAILLSAEIHPGKRYSFRVIGTGRDMRGELTQL